MNDQRIRDILRDAKTLAQEYRHLTGKPLGVTGEIAEYEAARLLNLELTPARQAGYDAIERQNGVVRRLQIKGRCVLPGSKPGQRVGGIDIRKEFDAVLLVLLNENLDATAIYEADRQAVIDALAVPGPRPAMNAGRWAYRNSGPSAGSAGRPKPPRHDRRGGRPSIAVQSLPFR